MTHATRVRQRVEITIPLFFLILILSCNQDKKIYLKMDKLSEKEIIIFYERDNYPPLRKDSIGNFIVELGTNNLFYTSTSFKEIKNCKTVYCLIINLFVIIMIWNWKK